MKKKDSPYLDAITQHDFWLQKWKKRLAETKQTNGRKRFLLILMILKMFKQIQIRKMRVYFLMTLVSIVPRTIVAKKEMTKLKMATEEEKIVKRKMLMMTEEEIMEIKSVQKLSQMEKYR